MININRLYKAMLKIDPEDEVRWYITNDETDTILQGEIYLDNTSIQSKTVIYGHSSNYSKYFEYVYKKLAKLKKVLDNKNED